MFWRQGPSGGSSPGRVLLRINSQSVIAYNGRTQHETNPMPIRFWSPIKSYRAIEWFNGSNGNNKFDVWYDDLEFWTADPK